MTIHASIISQGLQQIITHQSISHFQREVTTYFFQSQVLPLLFLANFQLVP
jgi:hypothetical protein